MELTDKNNENEKIKNSLISKIKKSEINLETIMKEYEF